MAPIAVEVRRVYDDPRGHRFLGRAPVAPGTPTQFTKRSPVVRGPITRGWPADYLRSPSSEVGIRGTEERVNSTEATGVAAAPPNGSRDVAEVPATGLAGAATVSDLLNNAPRSRFHRRAVVISGMGFFTDAYDLFVISTVAALVKTQWHLSTTQTSWVTGSAILAAFVGAFVFGRVADILGRKRIYVLVAGIMIVGALASAFASNFVWLVIARFVLGLGIGGDYPVSAVMMSEYSNRNDRGRLVGLVFSMQAIGLIVGPLVALILLSSGMASSLTWRVLLGAGALPAAAVIYLRSKMPESPRFKSRVKGDSSSAAKDLHRF